MGIWGILGRVDINGVRQKPGEPLVAGGVCKLPFQKRGSGYMSQVWIGFSEVLGFRDLIVEYIDPYFGPVEDEDEPVGRFERVFGASRNGAGSFEVYEKPMESDEDFDVEFVLRRLPFSERLNGLNEIDWCKAKTVFFMINDKEPIIYSDGTVTITDVLDVKFDWE